MVQIQPKKRMRDHADRRKRMVLIDHADHTDHNRSGIHLP